jgi:uncharacterized repeat protein (TIGR03803 family)
MAGRTFALLFGVSLFAATGAQAQTYGSLYDFCSQTACADGAEPQYGLVADGAGNLYGTTEGGGNRNGGGVAFELSPNGSGGWTYSVIHAFCSDGRGCLDGRTPSSGLIIDTAGNLYGTTSARTSKGAGLAYELMPQGGGQWTLVVMHNFCKKTDCIDGATPSGGLSYLGQRSGAPYDGTSPLYGTTQSGGLYNRGTVYRLNPPPSGGKSWWKLKSLHSFCYDGGNCLGDGMQPSAGVVVDSLNVLYGTTLSGGLNVSGTLFKLVGENFTHLYDFCSLSRCADGQFPGALAENGAGELIGGTTMGPHRQGCVHRACGTLFDFATATNAFTTLYTFCSQTDCADGAGPNGPVSLQSNGDIIGTAELGGDTANATNGGGVLYRLSGPTLTVLHDFCQSSGCSDSGMPNGGLVVDSLGRIFGTTHGVVGETGAIFEFAP